MNLSTKTGRERQGRFVDIGSDVPRPQAGIRVRVDREQAALYGVDIESLGNTVQPLTNGVLLGSCLPDFAPDEVNIRLRYPAHERTFAQLVNLRVPTQDDRVPIANFVTREPGPAAAAAVTNRVNSRNVQTISAGLVSGTTVAEELPRLCQAIDEAGFPEEVDISFAGEIEDQQETVEFLIVAFFLAVFLMFLALLTQLNSFFQSALVLSAIVFSLAGVFVGLIIRQEPFSIVMSGIGIMALAGIVVSNNIVLIDAYNEYRDGGMHPAAAALQAGTERLRPVLLTAITTMIGLRSKVFFSSCRFPSPSNDYRVLTQE